MACGCTDKPADWLRPHAAMCHTCVYAEHGASAWVEGATACTIDGKPVVGRRSCPRGKFDADRQVYRWLCIEWYGVPYPIRVALWLFHPKHPRPASFAGCGCVKALKDIMEKVHGTQVDRGTHRV
jgi:hypothetical protein